MARQSSETVMRDAQAMRLPFTVWSGGGGCGSCPARSLDCHVAALLAMTMLWAWCFIPVFRAHPPKLSLRGRSRRELTWQSSRGRGAGCPRRCVPQGCHCEPQRGAAIQRNRNAGCPSDASPLYGVEWRGRMRELPCAVAGLPRRCASRNDKGTRKGSFRNVRSFRIERANGVCHIIHRGNYRQKDIAYYEFTQNIT